MDVISAMNMAGSMYGQSMGMGSLPSLERNSFQAEVETRLGGVPESMDSIFQEAASRYGIPEKLIKSVARAESNFNPRAVSHAGAMGVMQLMPGTAKSLGVTDPFDARQNIMGGAGYLKKNLDRFGGDISLALAAYNAGPGSVDKYGGIPPYKETQNYVKKVTSYMGGAELNANQMVTTGSGIGKTAAPDKLYSLLSSAVIREDTDTVTMDKAGFTGLVQILRLQMMIDAGREVGNMNL